MFFFLMFRRPPNTTRTDPLFPDTPRFRSWNYHEDDGWDYDFTRRFENVEKKTIDSALAAVRYDFPVEWGEYRVDVFDPATKLTMRYPFRAGWSWNEIGRAHV